MEQYLTLERVLSCMSWIKHHLWGLKMMVPFLFDDVSERFIAHPSGDIQTPYLDSDSASFRTSFTDQNHDQYFVELRNGSHVLRHFWAQNPPASCVLFSSKSVCQPPFWGWTLSKHLWWMASRTFQSPVMSNVASFPIWPATGGAHPTSMQALMRFMEIWPFFQITWRKDEEKVVSTLDK